ncbi:MAG: ATP-dependent metallopeptidase FtsH/Yme1/Tma family protein [Planctomycetes bacterium]|nr:ATP-dependent metallopeptidase FtsH/Yme1/Tma family protein [Planctomycetota bacterium]
MNDAAPTPPEKPKRPDAASLRNAERRPRGALVFLLFTIVAAIVYYYGGRGVAGMPQEISYVEFFQLLKQRNIKTVEIEGNEARGQFQPGQPHKAYRTTFPEGYLKEVTTINGEPRSVMDHIAFQLENPEKNFHFVPPNVLLMQFILPLIPWVLLFVLAWYFLFRQIRSPSGPGGVLSFGRSRARLATKEQRKVTFDDVAGIEEAKEEVGEIIEFLRDPAKFQRIGGRIPRGVLLVGAPGTGKTLLAKAIAGEAEVPFFSICGSDFVEMFVGVGASRVRDLFRQAKDNSPCIIFLDEIDAVGRRRGSGLGGGHDEREQTLNAILVEMDGFDTDDDIIVIAATNRPDVLDPALLRPGRFDREIVIDLSDFKGREAILRVHAKRVKMGKDVDLPTLAKTTPSFSGADLEATINEAALRAVMKKKDFVEQEDLEEARDKVKWGRQKRSRVVDEEDRRVTAYHEAGHTMVSMMLPGVESVHKVSIVPRGMTGGMTMRLPDRDRHNVSKRYVLSQITVCFGGRAAEEIFCKDISAGAQNDLKQATQLARLMVCEWGMSEAVGPVNYMENEEHMFLGREIARTRNHSEATANEIDREVRRILEECCQRARTLLEENHETTERMARALLKYEVLNSTDVDTILKGREIERAREVATPPQPAT